MPKVVACIIARTVSKRLPMKVLRDLKPGVSMIDFLIQRVKNTQGIDEIYLCTSTENVDDILTDVAIRNGIKIYRGSADAVIERMIEVGKIEHADILIRITGDNPFASVEYIPNQISFLIDNKLDYTRIIDVPIGATTEVITYNALKDCYEKMDPMVSEYLMLYIFEPNQYSCGILKIFKDDYSNYSVTVDTPNDLERTKMLLSIINKDYKSILLKDIINVYNDSNYHLPAYKLNYNGSVKYPYDKLISLEEFNQDMQRRKSKSLLLQLYE